MPLFHIFLKLADNKGGGEFLKGNWRKSWKRSWVLGRGKGREEERKGR